MSADNPILNSPYLEPKLHYDTDSEGSLDYTRIRQGRRIFKADIAVIPTKQTGQKEFFAWNEDVEQYNTHLINLCRKELGLWRAENYPNTTRVQGKSYDSIDPIGKEIWKKAELLLEKYLHINAIDQGKSQFLVEEPPSPAYGNSILTKVRLGQGAFRVLVTDAYSRRCSITGEKTLPVLEAAHIKPYAESGPHFISNGILLRADVHKLFDGGYLTITNDLKVEVSPRIKEEFQNGKEYYQYHGKDLLFLPNRDLDKPSEKYIDWHNTNIYRG